MATFQNISLKPKLSLAKIKLSLEKIKFNLSLPWFEPTTMPMPS